MAVPKAQVLRRPLLSVIVPAYREEEYIEQTLRGILQTCVRSNLPTEIIVVVDLVAGDATSVYVRRVAARNPQIRIVERIGKRGVGDAVKTGIMMANGQIVVIVMADQSEAPEDIVRLTKACSAYQIVFTNRFQAGRPDGYPIFKYLANRACNLAVMCLFGIPFSDTTNAFKAYRTDILKHIQLTSNGFEIFLEMPVKVVKHNRARAREIEVSHRVRRKKSPKLSVIRDGYRYVRAMLSLLRYHAQPRASSMPYSYTQEIPVKL